MIDEKQIETVLEMSNDERLSDAIRINKQSAEGGMAVDIDPAKIKKPIPWSRISMVASIIVFILSILIIENKFAIHLSNRLSLPGLLAILASNYLSNFTGRMWYTGGVGATITKKSPESLIKFVGWIMLLIPIGYELVSRSLK